LRSAILSAMVFMTVILPNCECGSARERSGELQDG
jgi:hypothetical protein